MNSEKELVWWIFELIIPAELEESISWKLESMVISSFAFESNPQDFSEVKIKLWLPISDWKDEDLNELFNTFKFLANEFDLELLNPRWEKVCDEDWSLLWKKHWKPDLVGINFLILPAWLLIPDEYSKRIIIRLDPGIAFGTGSHPTTRLCIEAIERMPIYDKKVADLGCGSGILSLAALKKGAGIVYAIDTDPLAIKSTRDNASLNNIDGSKLQVKQGSILELEGLLDKEKVDLLICNILAPVIEELAPSFNNIIAFNGSALLSGLLIEQAERLDSVFQSLGWQVKRLDKKESWCCLSIARNE
tara:strand:+ start:313 stop:1224 length:912 start_codon:yes stop_codon:yes gene_type:complete